MSIKKNGGGIAVAWINQSTRYHQHPVRFNDSLRSVGILQRYHCKLRNCCVRIEVGTFKKREVRKKKASGTDQSIPSVDHLAPFQKDKNEFEPSDALQIMSGRLAVCYDCAYLPATKILLRLPSFTSRATTGPGRSEPEPKVVQVRLAMLNSATLVNLLFSKASDPPTTRYS